MSEQDNGKPPEPQQGQVAINIQVMPQGAFISCSYPVQLGIPDETMDALTEQWIMQRPLLQQKIAQRVNAAQKQELAIIRHINSRRVD